MVMGMRRGALPPLEMTDLYRHLTDKSVLTTLQRQTMLQQKSHPDFACKMRQLMLHWKNERLLLCMMILKNMPAASCINSLSCQIVWACHGLNAR